MFELGENEKALHKEVGTYIANQKADVVVCIGELSKNMYEGITESEGSSENVHYYKDKETMIKDISRLIQDEDIVLVKASHGMHFEEIINELKSI